MARKVLKWMHLVATVWFMICVVHLVVTGLRQAGLKWWLIFSLSGYSTFMVLILICLYLFAFFRGVGGARRIEIEHPVTSTYWYMCLYVSAPLLAGLVAILGMHDTNGTSEYLVSVAMETLKVTFIAWVVIDPLLGVLEMDSPASRSHRAERLARMKEYDRLTSKPMSRDHGNLNTL